LGSRKLSDSDPAELLKGNKESFNEISTSIDMPVIASGFFAIRPWQNGGRGVHSFSRDQHALLFGFGRQMWN
jgi:hypothetical protein